MPQGMVPELLIALVLVLLIAAVVVATRRRPPAPEEPEAGTAAEAAEMEVEAAAPVAPARPERVKPSLRERLAKSRALLAGRIGELFGGGPDDDVWDDLEATLIQADVGVDTATRLVEELRTRVREARIDDAEGVRALLAEELLGLFDLELERTLVFAPEGPTVWLLLGVNGTGKTTTIGKLAADLSTRGRTVALAAADTFRAAADEQLGIWADRAGAQLVKHQPGADPGAVAFDAYQHARARGLDVLIVDTAGRLHTKTPLMDELAKVRRVIEKEGSVQESLLVIDATAGQNGLVQAREFAAAAGVTGVVLTKLDGTAKGGIAVSIEQQLGIPIKLIGIGEGVDDLAPFEPRAYVDALLS